MNINTIEKRLPKNPVTALYRSQKLKNAPCLHLKAITYADIGNPLTEETESHPFCNQCGHLMDIVDMENRKKALEHFNNLKLQ